MKRFTLAMTAIAALMTAPIAAAEGVSLDVTVTGMETPSGVVRIALFQGEEAYENGPPPFRRKYRCNWRHSDDRIC